MKGLLLALFYALSLLGGFGLLLVGILDSSFLFMPLGNDLLVLIMTAEKPTLVLYFAAMATIGSTIGTAIIDWISRKGGEAGLQRMMTPRRVEFVKQRVEKHAGWALALAAIMPPPFPFTPVVAGAAAFQYPRRRLLAIVAGMRMLRFTSIGMLAMFFGASLLRTIESPAVQLFLVSIVVISIVGSILSLWSWIRRSRSVVRAVSHASIALLFLAFPATAEDGRLEVILSGWRTQATGRIQAGDLPVDLNSDLAVSDRWQFLGHLVARPGYRHAIVVEGSPVSLEGTNRLERTIVYAGRSYQIRDTIDSEARLTYFYAGYRYDLLRRENGFLGLQAGGTYLDANGTISSRNAGVAASKRLRLGLPLAGAAARAWITRNLHVDGEIKGMTLGRYGHFVTAALRGGVSFGIVSLEAGYAFLRADIHEVSGITGVDLSLRGPGLFLLFRMP